MKNLIAQIILIGLLAIIPFAQIPTPSPTPDRSAPVTVTQGFVDDANKAFDLVANQRDALEKYRNERATTNEERASADALIKGMNDFLALKDKFIAQYELMVTRLQAIIEFQYKIIDKLQSMLNKPKGFWQKLFDTAEKVLLLATGIMLGRGLGYLIRGIDPKTGIIEWNPGVLKHPSTYARLLDLERRDPNFRWITAHHGFRGFPKKSGFWQMDRNKRVLLIQMAWPMDGA